MSVSLTVNGVTFPYPQVGDNNWGTAATNWASAVTSGMLQKAGGSFPLTAEVDFGGSFGIKSLYYLSRTANPSGTGVIRLANADAIGFRNSGNSADILLQPSADGFLQYNSIQLVNLSGSQTLTNKTMSGSANTFSNIPLSAVTGTLPLVNGGTGTAAASANAAFNALSPMTTSGDIIYGGASGAGTRLAKGSDTQVLTLASGIPSWAAPAAGLTYPTEVLNATLALSVSSNALTIALKDQAAANPSAGSPVKVSFRSSTATSATYNERSVTGALSLVISSGSTLGNTASIDNYIYVYLIDNAGTVKMGVSCLFLDESNLYTTVAEGGAGAADSFNVLYSDAVYTSVPIRLIGRLRSSLATPGTWSAVPTLSNMIPLQPGATLVSRYSTTAGQSIGAGTIDIVDFGTKTFDIPNAVTTGAAWHYTIPTAGFYRVSSNLTFASASFAAGTLIRIFLYKNGSFNSTFAYLMVAATLTNTQGLGGSDLVQCSAGDTLDVRVRQQEAGARSLDTGAGACFVSITFQGPA